MRKAGVQVLSRPKGSCQQAVPQNAKQAGGKGGSGKKESSFAHGLALKV